jgi:hypothetical protein
MIQSLSSLSEGGSHCLNEPIVLLCNIFLLFAEQFSMKVEQFAMKVEHFSMKVLSRCSFHLLHFSICHAGWCVIEPPLEASSSSGPLSCCLIPYPHPASEEPLIVALISK